MSLNKKWLSWANRMSVLVVLVGCGFAYSALPPESQNEKDLDVMLSYVKAHPDVLSSLQAIDLGILTVYYGEGCSAEFTRKVVDRPKGWVGPAEPLVLKKNFCPEETTTAGLEGDGLGGITSRATDSCGAEVVKVKDEGCKITPE
ncbi:MAG: hypothetical protein ACPG47_01915 [Leucothrix sp.]